MPTNKSVRTRFAPSPTGEPHVGNIRTALFAWLFSRHHKGSFIVRVEDTDQARSSEGSVASILESLAWLGIDIDEGVVSADGAEKGDKGPYTQSKRLELYQKHAKELLDKGKAFYCFCSQDRLAVLRALQQERKEPPRYDGACLRLEPEKAEKFLAEKAPHVVRMKIPQAGETTFIDAVKGVVAFKNENLDYQVLLKADGFPTYHLASVVDDHLMEISHVLRADEWLASTPKHVLLYQYFGWEPPQFAHLPIILGPDRAKLSKRHGAVSVLEYKKDYMPEALINYLALLGWNPKTEQEILSRDELIAQFDLDKVNKNNPIFDPVKLNWLNSQYIKQADPAHLADLLKGAIPEGVDAGAARRAVAMAQERMEKLSDFPGMTEFLWKDVLAYDAAILVPKNSDAAKTAAMLKTAAEIAGGVGDKDWDDAKLRETFFNYCESNQIGKGDVLWPLRVSVTGLERSPDVFGVMGVLGKAKTLERIAAAQSKLK